MCMARRSPDSRSGIRLTHHAHGSASKTAVTCQDINIGGDFLLRAIAVLRHEMGRVGRLGPSSLRERVTGLQAEQPHPARPNLQAVPGVSAGHAGGEQGTSSSSIPADEDDAQPLDSQSSQWEGPHRCKSGSDGPPKFEAVELPAGGRPNGAADRESPQCPDGSDKQMRCPDHRDEQAPDGEVSNSGLQQISLELLRCSLSWAHAADANASENAQQRPPSAAVLGVEHVLLNLPPDKEAAPLAFHPVEAQKHQEIPTAVGTNASATSSAPNAASSDGVLVASAAGLAFKVCGCMMFSNKGLEGAVAQGYVVRAQLELIRPVRQVCTYRQPCNFGVLVVLLQLQWTKGIF
jgi:hypothetical protein